MELFGLCVLIFIVFLFLKIFAFLFEAVAFVFILPLKILIGVIGAIFGALILIPLGLMAGLLSLLILPFAILFEFLPIILLTLGIVYLLREQGPPRRQQHPQKMT